MIKLKKNDIVAFSILVCGLIAYVILDHLEIRVINSRDGGKIFLNFLIFAASSLAHGIVKARMKIRESVFYIFLGFFAYFLSFYLVGKLLFYIESSNISFKQEIQLIHLVSIVFLYFMGLLFDFAKRRYEIKKNGKIQ